MSVFPFPRSYISTYLGTYVNSDTTDDTAGQVNDPLPAAVGDKVLEIVVRDNLVENARAMGRLLHEGLARLQSRYECIGDVRGRGLMAGVEIVADRATKAPAQELAHAVAERAYDLGVWANLSSHGSFSGILRIAPPITITKEQVREGLGLLEEAFASTAGVVRLY